VHRYEIIGLDLLEGVRGFLSKCIRCSCQVEPANDGVELVDPSYRLDVLDGVAGPTLTRAAANVADTGSPSM
jgi:hypothetical protein